METYRQIVENLRPQRTKKQFYYFLSLGILYVILGFINFYDDNKAIWSGAIWFLTGIGSIIFSVMQKRTPEKYFIELNKNGIKAKVDLFDSIDLKWNDITEIDKKPISIVFKLKSDTKEILSLGYLSYANVIEFKSKLKEFADEKGIICH